ncbi:hypothetical protein KBY58_04420 [Cyanobium sp. HWJ4-Hawea]|uniref:hypothetical protein n=1 Tax=Cyanobium sp. HWJ4-Hawea TaxID=2823713 RepID=UPI0020CE78E3|nr:hypothetical protein [Cyanobium sp. HWJ4-Hawea]MCP9808674.1 hypothetical protein [Cyanobium sp. HWJ4-Hawea]
MHENPQVWQPSSEFLEQFGLIISPYALSTPSHCTVIQAHSAVPWFYGIPFSTDSGLLHVPNKTTVELDFLRQDKKLAKRKLISFVVSGKSGLPGHKWRLGIAKALEELAPGLVDIYGFGYRPLADKKAALDDYLYSIVIENSNSEYYWTEKLSDCILGRCMPIYAGACRAPADLCLNFPVLSYGENPIVAAHKILSIVELGICDARGIEAARESVLYRHNLLSWVPHLIESL